VLGLEYQRKESKVSELMKKLNGPIAEELSKILAEELNFTAHDTPNSRKWGLIRECVECNRIFDMFNEDDANEWAFGHDCEVNS